MGDPSSTAHSTIVVVVSFVVVIVIFFISTKGNVFRLSFFSSRVCIFRAEGVSTKKGRIFGRWRAPVLSGLRVIVCCRAGRRQNCNEGIDRTRRRRRERERERDEEIYFVVAQ